MNLHHLALFRCVAQCGNVSAAAQQLAISQSAVSKQVQDFEQALGLKLFDRLPRGVRLTEAGRFLLGYANRLFAVQAEAETALSDLQQLGRGRITLGASRTIGSYLLPDWLAAFHAQHPAIEVSLRVDNTGEIERQLLAGEIDIGFAEGVPEAAGLDYRVFAEDELVLIASPRHPCADAAPLSLRKLTRETLLMHEPGSGTRAVTEQALRALGLHLKPAMTLASTEALKQTVRTGVGLAFLSNFAVRAEVDAGHLRVLPVKGLRIRRKLFILQPRGTAPSPAVAAFLSGLGRGA